MNNTLENTVIERYILPVGHGNILYIIFPIHLNKKITLILVDRCFVNLRLIYRKTNTDTLPISY